MIKDEIKEIIESSRKIIKSNRENDFDRIIMLGDDIDKLIDYITNLQTIEQQYSAILSENAELENKITNLQQRCEYLERSNNRREDEIMSLRNECVDGETYKSRNEKAIKYIDDWLFEAGGDGARMDYEDIVEIKHILNGGDDNE